ncbi:sigma-70 family RNA polymerase sigma factor [Patulibacter minatonensis]|uniref:sigma-70 family RNA polymerase sigma factor n=1 Tax=Patulibacter minatonensis TaxID=298163 RepID=UPI0004B2FBD5|nr:sigma-70 family RNA polymerase sigma factor [Patulibacter minatonensis]
MSESYEQRDLLDIALIRLYRATGDPRRLDKLVQRFTPLVRSVVRQYTGRGESLDDLHQVGMLALMKALERFDASGGGSFGAYARPTIAGEIKRHFRDHTWAVKVPRAMQELQAKVARAKTDDPAATHEDLARQFDVTVAEVMDAEVAHDAYRAKSLDFSTPGESGSSPLDTMGSRDRGYDEVVLRDEIEDALSALGPRDREVVELRYFDERLQREIGQGIGVSQMQVSRILNRAIESMRDHLDPDDRPSDPPPLAA